jgi:microcystin-dependent protein
MTQVFLGEIKMAGYNFAPRGFALCNGQVLAISQNAALFSLLGTQYGGNGQSTYALPDLQGRAVMGQGGQFVIGTPAGTETVSLISNQYPSHIHALNANSNGVDAGQPTGNFLNKTTPGATTGKIYATPGALQPLNPAAIVPTTNGGVPHANMQPFLVMNYSIAISGIFPSRN